MQKTIPDKLYFKIGEVAKLAEVPTHVIRYWESEFVDIKPKRANSKQRLFRKQDIQLILQIKQLLHHQGYTINGAKKILSSSPESATMKRSQEQENPEFSIKLKKLKQELQTIQKILLPQKD